jgi:acetyl-CoA/propionyl-CoA carboxylase biotin carboxyl carrier protein
MLSDDAFRAGTHTTNYLDDHLDPDRLTEAQERWGTEPAAGGEDAEVTRREFTVEVDGKRFEVDLEERGAPAIDVEAAETEPSRPARAGPDDEESQSVTASGQGTAVTAEMQGTILDVEVSEGQEVAAGDVLLVLEAMKMENDVVADAGGTVTAVHVDPGDSVDMGDPLLDVE